MSFVSQRRDGGKAHKVYIHRKAQTCHILIQVCYNL